MSMALLGESFDLHCGGVDNIFPHHENEIAQSEAATGKRFVQIWCHSAHLRIGGEKMAKSLDNFSTIPDLVDSGIRPSALRYLLTASAHYRRTINYSDESMHAATESVDRLADFDARVHAHRPRLSAGGAPDTRISDARTAFETAMDDDLNLPEAMGAVFTLIRTLNRELDSAELDAASHQALIAFLDEIDDVLGVRTLVEHERSVSQPSSDETALLEAREAARRRRDWKESDLLRDALAERGIGVDDTPQGQRWHRL
jgi:cysteinyl-tRNA synthetase